MLLALLLFILACILFGFGFTVKWLFIIGAIVLIAAIIAGVKVDRSGR